MLLRQVPPSRAGEGWPAAREGGTLASPTRNSRHPAPRSRIRPSPACVAAGEGWPAAREGGTYALLTRVSRHPAHLARIRPSLACEAAGEGWPKAREGGTSSTPIRLSRLPAAFHVSPNPFRLLLSAGPAPRATEGALESRCTLLLTGGSEDGCHRSYGRWASGGRSAMPQVWPHDSGA